MTEPLLRVENLKTYFYTEDGVVKAVDGVSFEVREGETLGIVGESGSGKSVTSLSIMRLLDQNGKIVDGKIIFKGRNLLELSESEMRKIRGKEIAMIFQEPMVALNPVFTIGDQIMEAIILHQNVSEKEARKMAIDLLRKVGIPEPEKRVDEYPHQLSGGMRQRAMIAMALSCRPSLLIADEPTTALDVTIQAQILELMKELQKEYGMAIILITHDMGVVAEMSDKVAVMYAGKVVEYGDVKTIFTEPKHPYTYALLESIPRIDVEQERLKSIPGNVPDPLNFPPGCKFHPRCEFFEKGKCDVEEPELEDLDGNHKVRCFFWQKLDEMRHAKSEV
ncbi:MULTISPECIES: ABC transporter ATP-binding protein [Thermotoga]|uniref:Oligopeptide/dipeptide ABC transporter, ATPase subunit n=1 Tax=Thermotoga petrophila (strain ATCC BAA-488 / DSM 13995 / JCM 10881 / RKU-1) TaxID=390874 RepID=A5IJS0_THEP1|nr:MULTISPECIES: ABC transporter ATP-binding protein [Thermotoga]ABQ46443.1 oligopeptide/dipeptide ABC transporter, ATPase subunit [Thermotoga petrophila RKU-1]ACB08790.1 oligopeptide/dipeptide ABC transporter, ATPase subunit [Thermotoga sp. RQ2]AIY85985.1 oligopeptide/dipeptide ABC transporter ATPase [Thermotoga sp. 2812B]EJX26730.1 oligopeptide/dipeptide ABC transporter ATPase [Thermotoga sp. EMP]KAF2959997.1 peptide ABC transporter ATP-binding protein [Thermotoga sp. 38H-to]